MLWAFANIERKAVMEKSALITKRVLGLIGFAVLGFMLTRSQLLTYPAPFGAVLTAAVTPVYGAAVLFGTALGWLFGGSAELLPLAASAGAAFVFGLKLRGMPRKRADFTLSAFVSAAYLLTALVVDTLSGGGAGDILRSLIYSAVLAGLTYSISQTSAAVRSSESIGNAQILLAMSAAVCALCSVSIAGVSIGGVVAAYLILLASVRFGAGRGAVLSVAFALAAGLSSPRYFADFALMCIPALLCGQFAYANPIRAAALFLLTFSPIAVLFGSEEALSLIPASCGAVAIMVLTYRPAAGAVGRLMYREPTRKRGGTEPMQAAVAELSSKLENLSAFESIASAPLSDIVYTKVCISCSKSGECFDDNSDKAALAELDKMPPQPELGDICRALPYCTRIAEVRAVSTLAKRRQSYLFDKFSESRSSARLCSRMLNALGGVIADAEKAAARSLNLDKILTANLEKSLRKAGVRFSDCRAFANCSAEVIFPLTARVNEPMLTEVVSEALGSLCAPPECKCCGETLRLKFFPTGVYCVDIGSSQLPASKDFSGDVAEAFISGGYSYAILSDGMGIGKEARAAALTLVTLFKEFICAGFSVQSAVSMGSLIMGASVPEESFATLDILRVNTLTGAAEIYKAGGCRSYLWADGNGSMLREGGYPVGILDTCDVRVHRFFVRESAAVVMMTDGALSLEVNDCARAASSALAMPLSELAAELLQTVYAEKTAQKDDASVTVVRIERKVS